MKAFKFVRREEKPDGTIVMRSMTICLGDPGCTLYAIGYPSVPPPNCGPLTAFKNIQSLLDFMIGIYWPEKDRILEVEAQIWTSHNPEMRQMATLWRVLPRSRKTETRTLYSLPQGTLLCSSVTPIKDITEEVMKQYPHAFRFPVTTQHDDSMKGGKL